MTFTNLLQVLTLAIHRLMYDYLLRYINRISPITIEGIKMQADATVPSGDKTSHDVATHHSLNKRHKRTGT